MVVAATLVISGVTVYLGFPEDLAGPSGGSHSSTHTSCSPPTSPACGGVPPPLKNLTVVAAYSVAQTGQPVPFQLTGLPFVGGDLYHYVFGDGVSENSTFTNATHAYSSPGRYYIFATLRTPNGATSDNLGQLVPLQVVPQPTGSGGLIVPVTGSVVSNSTARILPTSVLRPGQTVTLQAWIEEGETNGSAKLGTPYYALAGSSQGRLGLGQPTGSGAGPASPLRINVSTFSTTPPGAYPVSFVVPITVGAAGSFWSTYSNFTFTVFVGGSQPGEGAAPLVPPHVTPPSPGRINAYELAPGGSQSEDPALDYEPVGMGPILNVYQTLVAYNGSSVGPSPADFVPDLATCVPGSSQCGSLYAGNTLVSNTGNYTFVINPAAQFYNAASGAHYGVYPSDVVFSLARTCLFSTYPGYQVNPGWIQCQSLLPNANVVNPTGVNPALAPDPSWDGGIHFPLNNTPGNILTAMTVNSTEYCPKVNGAFAGNGCVTFNTRTLTGTGWSYFLELMANPEGASIMSCAWVSANGGGIPRFSVVGDHCTVPAANSLGPTAWDAYMGMGAGRSYNYNTYLQWHMMGSGPYYMANLQISKAYYLQANPYWGGTTCVGGAALGCLPGPYSSTNPTFIPTVNVIWETSQTQGESAYAAGTADFASVPEQDTGLLLRLRGNGSIGAEVTPAFVTWFYPLDMAFNVRAAQGYTPIPINVPGTILQDLNFRQFLINSFPYATIQSTVNTVDGIQYAFPYGGAVPQFMGNFYPANISWPTADPSSNPNVRGTAGYWWAQFQNDSIYQALSTGNGCLAPGKGPCILPLMGQLGVPASTTENTLFAQEVSSLSHGKIEILPITLPFLPEVASALPSPGQNPMPLFNTGWYADYPDPTDYMAPLYQPDSTSGYTFEDAVMEGLASSGAGGNLTMAGQYYGYGGKTVTACVGGNTLSAPNGWKMVVTMNCQGWAYKALTNLVALGAACAPPSCSLTERALIYNNAEQIASKLGLYIYNFQDNSISSYSSWINPSGINTNPMEGGGGDQPWYTITYQNGGL